MKPKSKPIGKKTPSKKKLDVSSENQISSTPLVATAVQQETVIPQPKINPDLTNPIFLRSTLLLITALVIGWFADYLFWDEDFGLNFSVFLVICFLGGLYWLNSSGIRPEKHSLWLLFPFLFFAIFTFVRREPLTVFLSITFSLICAGLFATSYIGGRWVEYGLSDYLYKFFVLVIDAMAGAIDYFLRARRVEKELNLDTPKFPIWGLLRGLLITIPILLCFGSLLASGDAVFKQKLNDFFNLDDLTDNIFRTFAILFYAYVSMGVFIHSALKSADKKLIGEDKPIFIRPVLGFTESSVILGGVSVLFLAFVVVQFQYFFGGEKNIGITGFTYSEYARSGFNELLTVAFFSLILIMGLGVIAVRENAFQRRVYSWLSVLIALEVLVILTSAYQRLSLAIDWHGFSRLRLYPSIFMIWVGILFVTIVFLEIFNKERFFALAFVLAAIGFSATLTLVNVDAAIIRRNVWRIEHGWHFNPGHLASLSTDAVPELVRLFRSQEVTEVTRVRLGAVLLCYIRSNEINLNKKFDWQSFNYSEWKAIQLLRDVQPSLSAYRSARKGRSLFVYDSTNVQYECNGIY